MIFYLHFVLIDYVKLKLLPFRDYLDVLYEFLFQLKPCLYPQILYVYVVLFFELCS